MLIINNLKLLVRNAFLYKKRERDNYIKEKSKDEDSISLLADGEKIQTFSNTKGVLTNSMMIWSILPVLYLITSVLTVLILLFLNNREMRSSQSKLDLIKIPSYYDLPKIHPMIFHIYTCITSLAGLAIVLTLFSVLKQRFKVPEYRDHSFKLYIMMFFGLISNFLNFAKGFSPYFENLNFPILTKEIQKDIKIDLSHLLFLALIFFSVLFSIYSVSVLVLLRTKQTGGKVNNNHEDNWYNYKIVILCYLCVCLLVYIVFLLHDNKMLIFGGLLQKYIEPNLNFVIIMFPYFLHIINAVLMFSFYFELKYINLALSQNLEVDYLFEDSEQHVFQ